MKITGKKWHPILKEEVDVIQFEESDFNFNIPFEDLDDDTKANFLSFIKCGALPYDKNHVLYKAVVARWNQYKAKAN